MSKIIIIVACAVFLILAVFYLLTATFVKESGVEVNRPVSYQSANPDNGTIAVNIMEDGTISIKGKKIDIVSIISRMEDFKKEFPEGKVVITGADFSQSKLPIEILEQVRLAGIKNVIVATEAQ